VARDTSAPRTVLGNRQASRPAARRRELIEATVKCVGHPSRVRLREGRSVPDEQFIDRARPERQPPLEVPLAQSDLRVDHRMWTERTTAVGLRLEENRLPERRDPRDVCLEVELGDVNEDETDDRVHERPPVEDAHQPLAIGAALDVAEVIAHTHVNHYGALGVDARLDAPVKGDGTSQIWLCYGESTITTGGLAEAG
jgi:hypothetical protein